MNDHTARVLNATAAGLEVMAGNPTVWNTKPAIVDKVAAIEDKVEEIELLDEQITNGSGGTAAKRLARQNAAIIALQIARPMVVFALDTNNLELAGEIDFSWSELRYGVDQTSIDRWQLVHDRAVTHQTALIAGGYIEATWPGQLLTAIGAFGAERGKPKAKRSGIKAMNQAIKVKVGQLETLNTNLLDLLVMFKESHSEFYNAAKAAFQIDTIGVRHLALRVRYTDQATGVRLPLVVATIVEIGLSRTSGKQGVVEFSRQNLAQGNYVLRSELDNYDISVIENIGIDHENLVSFDIEMVKNTGSGTTTGNIEGVVRHQGIPVANATVSLQGQTISTTTDAAGKYLLPGVNAGNQSVTASLPPTLPHGTQTQQTNVTAGQTAVLNFDF